MRLLILGASGFIGTELIMHAIELGHEVVALCRSGQVDGYSGTVLSWQFGAAVPETALQKIDCAVHLAHDFGGKKGAEGTLAGTLAAIDTIRAAGVGKQLVFSSYSAGAHAVSLYGQTKYALEQALAGMADIVIIRPGLVLGTGGLHGRIRRLAAVLPVVPLPDGGKGLVPVIGLQRLCLETLRLASGVSQLQEANLFEPQLRSLRQLVLDSAAETGRQPWLMPVPSALVLALLQIAGYLHIPLPVNADNLKGFLANRTAGHRSSLQEPPLC